MKKMVFVAALVLCPLGLGVASATAIPAESNRSAAVGDVIAKVGDQTITFGEINTMLNSSAIVGVSIPALGTPERDTVRITLLDKFISANLLYLDALKQGVDKDPVYQQEVRRFADAILAGRYWDLYLAGEVSVTEAQIQEAFNKQAAPDAELTDQTRMQIASKLRKEQRKAQMAAAQKALRDQVEIRVHEENLAIEGDAERARDAPLAEVGGEIITWGELGDKIVGAGKGAVMADPLAMEADARRAALERGIDLRILVQKAKAAGVEADPLYQRRLAEFKKTRLINRHRERLIAEMEPSNGELEAFYEAKKGRFVVPEARKVQMVVVETQDEAESLKAGIEAGEMTMYQAARDHSIAVKAKQDLGEVGWVSQGELVPALDEATFSLGPGEIGGPVETPAGWHLVTVQDVAEARHTDVNEGATRELVRRSYLEERLAAYTVELRKNEFPVEVYEDRLVQLAQREADMVKVLTDKSQQPGSVTAERIKELQKFLGPQ